MDYDCVCVFLPWILQYFFLFFFVSFFPILFTFQIVQYLKALLVSISTQIHGVVVVMDFDSMSMKQVMGLTPTFSMRLLTFIQDAMPLRMKEVRMKLFCIALMTHTNQMCQSMIECVASSLFLFDCPNVKMNTIYFFLIILLSSIILFSILDCYSCLILLYKDHVLINSCKFFRFIS